MSKTIADHARAYRERKAAKLARYEAALTKIAAVCKPGSLSWEGLDIGSTAHTALGQDHPA